MNEPKTYKYKVNVTVVDHFSCSSQNKDYSFIAGETVDEIALRRMIGSQFDTDEMDVRINTLVKV